MVEAFCPDCGTQRTGERVCLDCGHDFLAERLQGIANLLPSETRGTPPAARYEEESSQSHALTLWFGTLLGASVLAMATVALEVYLFPADPKLLGWLLILVAVIVGGIVGYQMALRRVA